MRICLVINSLRCGGAERVAATLANEWTRGGHQMSLVTLAGADSGFYALDSRIDRVGLDVMGDSSGLASGIWANLSRLRRLRSALLTLRPDVVISFIDCMNVLVLIATFGLGIPVIVSERTDPRMSSLPLGWRILRRMTYRRAAATVVQTRSVAVWASGLVDSRRVVVIPNPIAEACFQIESTRGAAARSRRVVAMGRLSAEKGFDILIEAFARISEAHPDWLLVLAGEGPLDSALREQALGTRCAGRIEFAGLVQQPQEMLAISEIFVLPSRREGFPNALLEAMACGCCVIATDCQSGPAEIISGGVDGVLVPVENADALAHSLDALMTSGDDRIRLGVAAARSARRFRAEGIAARWIHLLRSVSKGGSFPVLSLGDGPQFAPKT